MPKSHLEDTNYYTRVDSDPSNIAFEKVKEFADKYSEMLTVKEHDYLINAPHKMSNIYMLPKLHKSPRIDQIILQHGTEYIHIKNERIPIEGRPINSGPCYFTRGLSLIIHEILFPALDHIEHVLKDTFDFKAKFEKSCHADTLIATWDIKSLYTNLRHDLCIDAIDFWVRELGDRLPLMDRFSRAFVLEALYIVLKFNYVHINWIYFHQHKGGAMGAPCMVVVSNLVVAFLERRMFNVMPEVFPRDFVDYFIRNYFRFVDDVIHQWMADFDIDEFGRIINSLDPDIKFVMDQISQNVHYLDVNIKVVNDKMVLDIYYKPTNAFSYVRFNSCHPRHTRENLAGALSRRIIQIVSENRDNRLSELSNHLKIRGYPSSVINDSFSKVMSPQREPRQGVPITFIHTFNPNHVIDLREFREALRNVHNSRMKKAFDKKWVLCSTKQPSNIRNMLTKAKFLLNPPPREPRSAGLVPCGNCSCCNEGFIVHANEFTFIDGRKNVVTWTYNRLFSCESRNVLYVLVCLKDPNFYVGKADDFKQRCRKHASDVRHPHNSYCRKCAEHLRLCSNMVVPYFRIYPFFYVDDPHLRHIMERRFIDRWRPTLNSQ